jgi:hypothetical protein
MIWLYNEVLKYHSINGMIEVLFIHTSVHMRAAFHFYRALVSDWPGVDCLDFCLTSFSVPCHVHRQFLDLLLHSLFIAFSGSPILCFHLSPVP